MTNNRIQDHPILGNLDDEKQITFTFDGESYEGLEGDTIASALLANGIRTLRVHEETGTSRGIYCNIGHCFECRLTVNNVDGIRACMTVIEPDMVVKSGKVQPAPLKPTAKVLPKTYEEFEQLSGDQGDDHDDV